MTRVLNYGEEGICCENCKHTLFDDFDTYERCATPIQATFEYENRGNPYTMIIQNKWYIPKDDFNFEIKYCSYCGVKLNWKEFFENYYLHIYLKEEDWLWNLKLER